MSCGSGGSEIGHEEHQRPARKTRSTDTPQGGRQRQNASALVDRTAAQILGCHSAGRCGNAAQVLAGLALQLPFRDQPPVWRKRGAWRQWGRQQMWRRPQRAATARPFLDGLAVSRGQRKAKCPFCVTPCSCARQVAVRSQCEPPGFRAKDLHASPIPLGSNSMGLHCRSETSSLCWYCGASGHDGGHVLRKVPRETESRAVARIPRRTCPRPARLLLGRLRNPPPAHPPRRDHVDSCELQLGHTCELGAQC